MVFAHMLLQPIFSWEGLRALRALEASNITRMGVVLLIGYVALECNEVRIVFDNSSPIK